MVKRISLLPIPSRFAVYRDDARGQNHLQTSEIA